MIPDVRPVSAAGERERGGQVGRELGRDVDLGLRQRVREPEPPGVQELALEPEVACHAVDGIAAHREADRLEMDADLVRAPGLEPDVEQRVLAPSSPRPRTT